MKTTVFFYLTTLAFLLQLATAQPHGARHRHRLRQEVVVTEVDYVTVEVEEVIIFVDEAGRSLSATTFFPGQAVPTAVSTSAPLKSASYDYMPTASSPSAVVSTHAAASTPAAPPAPASSTAPASSPAVVSVRPSSSSAAPPAYSAPSFSAPTYSAPAFSAPAYSAPAYSSPAHSIPAHSVPAPASSVFPSSVPLSSAGASSSAASAQSTSGSDFRYGVSYSPYYGNGNCKSESDIAKDLQSVNDFSILRLYGTDCDQVAKVLAAVRGKKVQIFAGIFDLSSLHSEVQAIVDAVKANAGGNWGVIHTVNVGNELVNNGAASVGAVVSAVDAARSQLRAAGYAGPVVTVDTMIAMKNNIALCQHSDYCAINCHAFFDGGVSASGAGKFVLGWAEQISALAGGKKTVVTESGWPSAGNTHGVAIPSPQNQQAAIASLKAAFAKNLVLYSAYNNDWLKDNPGTFSAEHFWGIYGMAPTN